MRHLEGSKLVYIIGGVPGVGKTSMSGKLASELGIDIVLSGDYLREFLRPYDAGGSIAVSVYDAWKAHGVMSRETVIMGYLDQAAYLSEGIRRIIRRSRRDGERVILETLYFTPEMWQEDSGNSAAIAYLYVQEETVHRDKLLSRTSYTHLNESGERLAAHLFEYRTIMDYSLETCSRLSIPAIETSDYEAAYEKLRRVLEIG